MKPAFVIMEQRDVSLPARAKEILEYYLQHQRTADTLEGIAEWLLLEELVQRRVEETETALRWLVARGYLQRSPVPADASPLYSLNTDKIPEAEQLVRETKPD